MLKVNSDSQVKGVVLLQLMLVKDNVQFNIIVTSFGMSAANPFKLQTDNKKFFFDVVSKSALDVIPEDPKTDTGANRIKNMSQELTELAKRREEMLFKDSQINYIFKKEKPVIQLGDFITSAAQNSSKEKKFRVRALLKEKRESLHEFLQKKKQIYLSKMNINIKKEQTAKLEDAIKDEKETLNARKLYFENDVEFMHKFIEGIKKQAEEAQTAVETQLKIQQNLVSRLNGIEAETQKIDNLISKDTEVLNNLKTYKQFIDSFHDPERNWKPYVRRVSEQPMFLTENTMPPEQKQNLTIKYQPVNLLQIFTNAEQNNIREIQNLHDKQDEVEVIVKSYNKLLAELERIKEDNVGRIAVLDKNLEKKINENNKLRELKKNNVNKINIFDNENIDLEKLAGKVIEIFREISPKKAGESLEGASEKVMKKAMTEIQHEIERLQLAIKRQKQLHPALTAEVQKQIKQNQKKQNQIRKKQEAKELQLKKLRQQQKKRNEPPNEMIKGRRDMQKVMMEKKVAKKKEVDIKTVDESEKYFADD